MRAIQVKRLDGPSAVELVEIDEPSADDAVVIVDVAAAGITYPDVLLTRGKYQLKPPLPFVVGSEVAGVVRSAPADAGVSPGDRVLGLAVFGGGAAEVVALLPGLVFPLPANVSLEQGAGLLTNDFTAHFALRERGRLRGGETVLVHGAAGGVGTSALRMARALGAGRTIGVVSTPEKGDVARAAGATDVVLVDGWLAAVKNLTGAAGVDIVIDPVGGDRFTDSVRSLGRGGRLLVIGFTGGEIPTVKVNRLLLNNVEVVGVGWGEWVRGDPTFLAEQWKEIRALLESGALSAPDPVVFPLDQAAAALDSLESRTATGKIVLGL
ncbi:zinc-binding dehydrogenase [Antrihabitans stalactiti]|uniref:NADPH:quinone oxidoreductase family protein n=1 Tax=Antrihabitans stalactiti TaxID=2584121 RepID=A0A848KPQ4_9NOCA|nr:NADPH:quinone oxidoreductase family protein [Antrihabitans stalactiti]